MSSDELMDVFTVAYLSSMLNRSGLVLTYFSMVSCQAIWLMTTRSPMRIRFFTGRVDGLQL